MALEDNFRINLNQNLWVLVVAFLSLGLSEYYDLQELNILSLILGIGALASVGATLFSYTYSYCKKKLAEKKGRC